jgi:hypothetical protein
MGSAFRQFSPGALLLGWSLAICPPSASAQAYGSLGGYGAASNYGTPGMGSSGAMVIPYGGMFEGFMPSRMGGGTTLSFRSRPTAAMSSSRTSFSLSPLSGGMSAMSGGLSGSRAGARAMSPIGPRGAMGLGGGTGLGGMQRMPGAGGTNVMPPSIGYPFRQPPSLVSPSATSAGMSM